MHQHHYGVALREVVEGGSAVSQWRRLGSCETPGQQPHLTTRRDVVSAQGLAVVLPVVKVVAW
jgi:hypothetical protein